jgi:hypothetical protein
MWASGLSESGSGPLSSRQITESIGSDRSAAVAEVHLAQPDLFVTDHPAVLTRA